MALVEKVSDLLRRENERPFYHYLRDYYEEGTTDELPFIPSELVMRAPPPGVRMYFSFDSRDGTDAEIDFFAGGRRGPDGRARPRRRS